MEQGKASGHSVSPVLVSNFAITNQLSASATETVGEKSKQNKPLLQNATPKIDFGEIIT